MHQGAGHEHQGVADTAGGVLPSGLLPTHRLQTSDAPVRDHTPWSSELGSPEWSSHSNSDPKASFRLCAHTGGGTTQLDLPSQQAQRRPPSAPLPLLQPARNASQGKEPRTSLRPVQPGGRSPAAHRTAGEPPPPANPAPPHMFILFFCRVPLRTSPLGAAPRAPLRQAPHWEGAAHPRTLGRSATTGPGVLCVS